MAFLSSEVEMVQIFMQERLGVLNECEERENLYS